MAFENRIEQIIPEIFGNNSATEIPNLVSFEKIDFGWENEVFSLTVTNGETKKFILKLYVGANGLEKFQKEFVVFNKLAQIDFTVPRVLYAESDKTEFGAPFMIMDKIPGKTIWQHMLERPRDEWQRFIDQFCNSLALLHQLDYRQFLTPIDDFSEVNTNEFVKRELNKFRKLVISFDKQEFWPAILWLDERQATISSIPPVLTHGDYNGSNVIVSEINGQCYLIDWGNAEVADPRRDLSWMLLLMSNQTLLPIERNIFLESYQLALGEQLKDVDYFYVMAMTKRLLIASIALTAGGSSVGLREDVAISIKKSAKHLLRIHNELVDHTQICLPNFVSLIS